MAEGGSAPAPRPALAAALERQRRDAPADDPGLALQERSALGIWQIAAWRDDEVAPLRAALADRLGFALPHDATASGAGQQVALGIAPRRWWLVEDPAGAAGSALAAALAGRAALTDLSHARCVLRLRGAASRLVLAKLCRIDLHPAALPAGRIAQTALGQVPALIHAVGDGPDFDLYLPRSLGHSAAASLIDAAAEFGIAIGDQAG